MRQSTWLLASAGIAALALTATAHAQTAPQADETAAAPQDEADASAEIVVSGSRIDRAGFAAPTPTTVVGVATLEQRAAVNVAEVLNEVPSFRRSSAPEAGGIGNSGANNVDLRGLGPIRTLVLLDRMRLPSVNVPGQTVAGVPDLNMIPTALLKTVDIVTGGASAAYGSDAVAGVVNLQLNTKFQGLKANLQYGQTKYNDAQDYFASLAGGTSFAEGRGHVVVGFEYNSNEGTDDFNTRRAWGRRNVGLVSFSGTRPAGVPANLVADNIVFGTLTTGGLITPTASTNPVALRNLQFVAGPNGTITTAPFNAGLYQGSIGTSMVGGSNVDPYQVLRGASRRYNVLANLSYDVTPDVTAWVQPLYAHSGIKNVSAQIRAATGGTGPFLTIRPDNYYLGQALTPAQLALVPAGGLTVGYLGNDFGPPRVSIDNDTWRVAGGLRGTFGGSWRWDVSAQYGKNTSTQIIDNAPITANFTNAVDAVVVTPGNVGASGLAIGSIACRSRLTTPSNGCVPINILGQAQFTQAAYDYIFTSASARSVSTLTEVSANLSGEPFSLWAGPVSLGVGGAYRRETLETVVDARSQSGALTVRAPRNFPFASQTVKEGYIEVIAPLLDAESFPGELTLNGAARITDYSISGSVATWKGGLTWKPVPELLFRSTLSRDIRAPSLPELFTANVATVPAPTTTGTMADLRPAFASLPAYTFNAFTGGSTALKPEVSKTFTVGAVFSPTVFGNRLQFSVDFYRIRVRDAIGSLGAGTIIQNCLGTGTASAGNPYCQLITFANGDLVNGAIQTVNAANANFAEFRTKGLDFAFSYTQPLDQISASLPGRLALNVQATHVMEYRASTDVSILYPDGVNRAGQTGALFGGTAGLPSWVMNANLNYRVGRLDLNAQVRHISKSRQNNALIGPDEAGYSAALFNSINDNVIPAVTYLNLGVAYKLGTEDHRAEIYFNVNNVFDKDPPLPAINNNAWYDILGRTYRMGVRFAF